MGGSIGFTLREEDGTEHRTSHHTGMMPYMINNIELAKKNKKYVASILKEWKKEQKLPESERDYYFTENYLAPVGYGIVVVDLMKNKILYCNDYTSFCRIAPVQFRLEMPVNPTMADFDKAIEDPETLLHQFYEFYKAGRIKDFLLWDVEKRKYYSWGKDINKFSKEELLKLICTQRSAKELMEEPRFPHFSPPDAEPKKENLTVLLEHGRFELDMSPLEVVRYESDTAGYIQIRKDILDLGFVLTDEEEQIWKERIEA